MKEIQNNISEQNSLYVQYNNEDIKLCELCKDLELNYKSTWQKINRGGSIEEILKQEVTVYD